MKGISAIISTVLLLAIVFGLASLISPWLFNLTTDVANDTSTSVTSQLTCQNSGLDFDSNFGSSGVDFNFSSSPDRLDVKVVNTGSVNLHSFSIEIEIDQSGLSIKDFAINSTYQKTQASPLRPGQSAILKANVSEDLNGTLREVKVLNGVCPERPISLRY